MKRYVEATEASVCDFIASTSFIAVLDDDERHKVLKGVREIVERGEGKVWIDESNGVFRFPYNTQLVSSFSHQETRYTLHIHFRT